MFVRDLITKFPQRLLVALVDGYRLVLKPWLGLQCRFEPTCSAYAREALQTRGAVAGSYLATRRLLRCHPWCDGGVDPVPSVSTRMSAKQSRSCLRSVRKSS